MTEKLFVCGTRAVVQDGDYWQVVCATCGEQDDKHEWSYLTKDDAVRAAVNNSSRQCYYCRAK